MKTIRFARTSAQLVLFVALGFLATLAAVMSVPVVFGYHSFTMLSGSMSPTIPTGSVVVDQMLHPMELRPGDVVTFTDPDRPERLLTHRLRSMEVEGQVVHMATRGDANDADEYWDIPLDGTVGRVAYSVPVVGYARAYVHQQAGRKAVYAVLAVTGLWILIDVWLPVPVAQLLRSGRSRGRRTNKSANASPRPTQAVAARGEL